MKGRKNEVARKGRQKDERTLKLKKNYIKEHESGLSTKEIAEKYGVSVSTVYAVVNELEQELKIDRFELLTRGSSPHLYHSGCEPVSQVDSDAFRRRGKLVMQEITNAQAEIASYVNDQEEAMKCLK